MKTEMKTAKMKVFKFFSKENVYAIAASSQILAEEYLKDDMNIESFDKVEDVPQDKWDEKIIEMYEDNDREKEQFYISIREAICGDEPQIIFTNDSDCLNY
jgi:hypothetical protein